MIELTCSDLLMLNPLLIGGQKFFHKTFEYHSPQRRGDGGEEKEERLLIRSLRCLSVLCASAVNVCEYYWRYHSLSFSHSCLPLSQNRLD
jgi:hypothetical protein